jgi:hypothetical protein
MEREYKCQYLGESIGTAESLAGPWPLYECEAPDDFVPSHAGRASLEDGSVKDFCRVASSNQDACSGFKPSEKVSLIRLS